MKKIFLFVTLAVAALAISCQQKEVVPDAITVTSQATEEVTVEGGVVTINFTSNVAWEAKSSQQWVTLSPAKGDAGEKLTIKASVLKNETTDGRSAEVTITGGTASAKVTINQGQKDAVVVPTTEFAVDAEGGVVEIPFSANVNVEVVIPEAVDWIKQTTPNTKGMEDGTVYLMVDASYDVEVREATIKVGTANVKISQAAFEPYYDMELPEGVGMFSGFGDGNPLVLAADATSFTIPVSTNMEHYCYFAPWDSTVGAAVETQDVGWIKFEYDNEKIVFTIEPNTGYVPREEYFYSGCFVGDIDFGAYGSCILIRQDGLIPEAGANLLWTKLVSEISTDIKLGYNRLAYKTDGGDALLMSDGEKVHVLNPADGSYWKAITYSTVKPVSICSDEAGYLVVADDIPFSSGSEYDIYYTTNVNEEPVSLIHHTADFDGTLGSIRVRGKIAERAVVTGIISGNRYWAAWEIDQKAISMDNYYAQGTGGQARGPIAHDADMWNPESGAVMSIGPRLNEGIVYRAYDTNWCLNYLADAYTPNWLVPYQWAEISNAGAGAGNENQNNMDIIDYQGRKIMAYTQGAWFTWGGNHDIYFLDVTNPANTEVIAIASGDQIAAVTEIAGAEGMAAAPYADVKLHVEDDLGLVCYVVNSTYGSLSKFLIVF